MLRERLLAIVHRPEAGALEVSLGPEDIADLERDDALELPGAVAAMASLARANCSGDEDSGINAWHAVANPVC